MNIAIVVPSLSRYDAVGNDVLAMYRILKQKAYKVMLFAKAFDPAIPEPVTATGDPVFQTFLDEKKNLVIYHHSYFSELYDRVAASKSIKVLRYHNITPPHFLEKYDQHLADGCRKGLEQMASCGSTFDSFWPASQFNADELQRDFSVNPKHIFVLSPFHPIEHWDHLELDAVVLTKLKAMKGSHILNIGRIVPHKNHVLLLESFADYHHNYDPHSHLHIVGKAASSDYVQYLARLVGFFHLDQHVTFYTEGIADSMLKALFERADCFMTTSLHEGFCVPLVEAMYFGLPLLALDSSAVGETLGQYGILLSEPDPVRFSIALHIILEKAVCREFLVARSKESFPRFQYSILEKRFLELIERVTCDQNR